jgi:uncharacterized protein with HEPN domain
MIRSDLERLRDARDFARHAQNNAGGLPAEVLADAWQPQHAALFDLVVIGEALNGVSGEVRSAALDISWQPIVDLRNFIVHAYWQVDLEIIAGIIEDELDPLIEQLGRLIAIVERSSP